MFDFKNTLVNLINICQYIADMCPSRLKLDQYIGQKVRVGDDISRFSGVDIPFKAN